MTTQPTYMNVWRTVQHHLLNLLFPETCVSCKRTGAVLCDRCLSRIPIDREHHDGITSIFSYRSNEIRKALWSLKYKNNKRIARVLAAVLYDAILEDMGDARAFTAARSYTLIPIPLHAKRQKQRGYNQSELICKELSLIDPVSFTYISDVLYRKRDTPSQTTLQNKAERIKNVRDCFAVTDPSRIKNTNIILIDDITTTGSTLKEAMKILRKNGAKKVAAYTVAH